MQTSILADDKILPYAKVILYVRHQNSYFNDIDIISARPTFDTDRKWEER